jgi:phosphoserine phosphatase RsbU/P
MNARFGAPVMVNGRTAGDLAGVQWPRVRPSKVGTYTFGMTGTELAAIFIGSMLLALGLVSTVAAALRLRRGSAILLTFGLWTVLYGVRLLASQPPVQTAVGGSPQRWAQLVALITYAINVPITLFVGSLLGSGWRNSVRWIAGAAIAFAIVAAAIELASGTPKAAATANSWFVLASLSIGLVNVFLARSARTPLTDPIVMFGGVVLTLFVINENVGGVVAAGVNVEPVGVLIFVLCLGYAVGRSVVRAEADFASVQRELEHARQIQSSLLPRHVPRLDGLEVAVRYVPMNAVAGDIYDFVRLGPSSVGIMVADVMGHGIPAALVASMVKLAFSVQAEHARDPARVLEGMNRVLCGQLVESYVTAVYAVVDSEQRTITLANAGHPAPLIHRNSNGATQVTGEHGLLLGFVPDAHYSNTRIEAFDAGDRLLLYSDGVLEARNGAGDFFDAERVARWLSDIDRTTAERFADIALDELTRWSERPRFDDDVTFVVAQFGSGPVRQPAGVSALG